MAGPQKPSIARRLCFTIVAVALVVMIVEATSLLLIVAVANTSPSGIRKELLSAKRSVADASAVPDSTNAVWINSKILHPYIGFVFDTDNEKVNRFGFHGDPPLIDPAPDDYVIAITGGSVAMGFFQTARDLLVSELQKYPPFADRRIHVISLSEDGMKQPQQLMALNFFLALGYRFDCVINLDGFNDAVLPHVDNATHGVFPLYPRSWKWHANNTVDARTLRRLIRVARLQSVRIAARAVVSHFPLYYSPSLLLSWRVIDRRVKAREHAIKGAIGDDMTADTLTSAQRGPAFDRHSLEDVVVDSVALWQQSSQLMADACRSRGVDYFHFLQPNQYVRDSKVFSEWEIENAIGEPDYMYRALRWTPCQGQQSGKNKV